MKSDTEILDKKITKEDIENVITKNIEKNIFELTNAIVNRNLNLFMLQL